MSLRPIFLALTTTTLAACPGEPGVTGEPGTSSGESGPSGDPSSGLTDAAPTTTAPGPDTSSVTTSTSDVTATTSAVASTTSASTGPDDGECVTLLCGDPLTCCAADDECLAGACVPACASGVRCGADQATCCADGELCLDAACVAPLGACTSSADCDDGSACDPVLAQCIPLVDPPTCEPPDIAVALELAWSLTTDESITIPLVVDLDGDGAPEVVVNTMRATDKPTDYAAGELVCLDGATGDEKWRIPNLPNNGKFGPNGRTTLAAGDVDGDDDPDIIYAGRPEGPTFASPIYAVDGAGKLLWTAHDKNNAVIKLRVQNGAPALANLDDDPEAELAYGAALFDHDGLLVWNQNQNGGVVGSPHAKAQPSQLLYPGGLATFADLTGDGHPELVTGREAWTIDWDAGDPPTVALNLLWKDTSGDGGDGYPAVADLDDNGTPEVVLIAWPEIKILDGKTGQLWCGVDPTGVACTDDPAKRTQPHDIPGGNVGGPPTIADYDGDGRPEFAISTGSDLRVFDLHRPGEVILQPNGDPVPKAGAIFTRWRVPVQDQSSASSGSSALDLDDDGASEVLHQDECYLRVLSGHTGDVLLELANSSATIHEYPVASDVDHDGRTDLLVVANLSDPGLAAKCIAADPMWSARKGVYRYRAADGWAAAASLWTSHTHHVTNVDPGGNVPLAEQAHWKLPGRNNFREASHADLLHAAADLTAGLAIGVAHCPDQLVLRATVYNTGALAVPAGIDVIFYAGTDELGAEIATVQTLEPLVPGGSTVVETTVPASADPGDYYALVDAAAEVAECREDNNGAPASGAACPI